MWQCGSGRWSGEDVDGSQMWTVMTGKYLSIQNVSRLHSCQQNINQNKPLIRDGNGS